MDAMSLCTRHDTARSAIKLRFPHTCTITKTDDDDTTTTRLATTSATSLSICAWLPIATALLLFLAQRAIKKDEQKVRAADRLR